MGRGVPDITAGDTPASPVAFQPRQVAGAPGHSMVRPGDRTSIVPRPQPPPRKRGGGVWLRTQ
ncbi:MAG: hypothetical protein ACI30J_00440 [Paludibacteraceae bacterium]